MNRDPRAFLAGAGAGIVATLAAYVGRTRFGVPMVHEAFNEWTVRLIPYQVFSFFIVRLKFAAKPLAFAGTLVVGVVLFGLLGVVYARTLRRVRRGVRGLAAAAITWLLALGLLWVARAGIIAPPVTAEVTPGPLPLAAVMLVYGLLFDLFLGAPRPAPAAAPGGDPADGVSRRELLGRAVVVTAGVAAGGALARGLWSAGGRTVASAQSLFDRLRGLPPEVTPTGEFYVVSKNFFDPTVNAKTWTLEVAGLVEKPYGLTYDELRALPSVTQYQTLECISNEVGGELISNATWKGVRLRDLIERAGGVKSGVVKIAFRCADGYTESIVLDDAMSPTTLVAYEINGEALPPKHGFPARLLVPGLFGMKNPKWLTRIEATDKDFKGYWEQQGWSDEAVVKTMSKFVVPARNSVVAGDEVGVAGVAYAGDRGVREVEFSVDGGKTWHKAEIRKPLGKFTWILWGAFWRPPAPGEYRLVVRARDGNGITQESRETRTLPDGASGYHRITIRVRK